MFWGPISQVEISKVGVPGIGSKPFPSEGEDGSGSSLLTVVAVPQVRFMVYLSLFSLFYCGFLLVCPIYTIYSDSFGFPSDRISLCKAVNSVSAWKEVSSGTSYITSWIGTPKELYF